MQENEGQDSKVHFELKSMFRQKNNNHYGKKEKGTADAGPAAAEDTGFLCFSNIYPLIAQHAVWDRKQDGVLLGPGSANVHTYTPGQTEQRKTKQMGRFRCERSVMIMMETHC